MRRPTLLDAAIPVGVGVAVGVHATIAGVGPLDWLFETVLLIALVLALRVAVRAYLDARRERDRAGELQRVSTAEAARGAVEIERIRLSREIEARVRELLGSVAKRAQQAMLAADPTAEVRAIQDEATQATSELRRQLGLLRPEPHVAIVTDLAQPKSRLTVLDLFLPVLVVALALTEIEVFAPMEGRAVSGVSALLTTLTAMTLVGRRIAPMPAALAAAALMMLGASLGDDVQDGFWAVLTTGTLAWALAALGRFRSWITLVVLVSAVLISRLFNEPDNAAISAIFLVVAAAAGAAVGRSRRLRVLAEMSAEHRRREIQTATEEAVRAERQQVARELHDLVSHAVSVIAIQAGAAELQWPVDRSAALRAIEIVQSTATQTVAELDRMPLATTPIQHTRDDLEALVDRARTGGQRVRLTCRGEPASDVMPTIYRVVQESLTNALRYAPGGVVEVGIEASADRTVVEVTSLGSLPVDGGRHGYGLVGLAERVAQLEGTLDAGPRKDPEGFAVRAVLPDSSSGTRPMTELGAPIRVLLADDHDLLRAGLISVLSTDPQIEVVGECGDGRAAVRMAADLDPDVVLMDIEMPGGDGITATSQIHRGHPAVRVLVLTTFDLDDYVLEALRAGASGFLLKTTPPRALIAAIKACAAGETSLGPSVIQRLVDTYVTRRDSGSSSAVLAGLTAREAEVLRVMARGKSNAEIGAELYLAETTVKTHVTRILAKLGVRDRVQAVVIAHDSGLMRG